jgi:uncharacterized protein
MAHLAVLEHGFHLYGPAPAAYELLSPITAGIFRDIGSHWLPSSENYSTRIYYSLRRLVNRFANLLRNLFSPATLFPDMPVHPMILLFRRIFTLPILLYKHLISPLLPGACIYTPTCSSYFIESLMRHGLIKGFILGCSRIFRCAGGLFTGGDDPVPQKFSFRKIGENYRAFWARGKRKK